MIIDEAHKCSVYTKSASGRSDEVEKTKRYQLAEHIANVAGNLLLLTATPHHGDDDRYWLYVVWDPLANPDPEPLKIRNPVKHLDHAKREVVRYFDIPADAILNAAKGA